MQDSKILAALEQLGALYPWDKVAIWINREPCGTISFTVYLSSDSDRAVSSAYGFGATIEEAIQRCRKDAGERDPEKTCQDKIRELEEALRKLRAANFGIPPYRPGYHLAPGALNLSVDIEATATAAPAKDDVPF